jgi:ribosomal protein L37AE/L43A
MATIKWQCNKCGKQTITGGSAPTQQSCPNGGYHVWGRLGRFLKQIVELL